MKRVSDELQPPAAPEELPDELVLELPEELAPAPEELPPELLDEDELLLPPLLEPPLPPLAVPLELELPEAPLELEAPELLAELVPRLELDVAPPDELPPTASQWPLAAQTSPVTQKPGLSLQFGTQPPVSSHTWALPPAGLQAASRDGEGFPLHGSQLVSESVVVLPLEPPPLPELVELDVPIDIEPPSPCPPPLPAASESPQPRNAARVVTATASFQD